MSGTEIVFWAFAALAMGSALCCITRRSPVASALWLVVTLFSLAALFVVLDAQFIAVLQVLVYAGAIMVLFLFVIMLLNLGRQTTSDIKGPVGLAVGVVLAGVLGFQLGVLRVAGPPEAILLPPDAMARAAAEQGMVASVARPLFDAYLVPFEITSVLLLAAIVGAVVLAKRRL
jgi:NADH-quinone oxidoreductase subunit J